MSGVTAASSDASPGEQIGVGGKPPYAYVLYGAIFSGKTILASGVLPATGVQNV